MESSAYCTSKCCVCSLGLQSQYTSSVPNFDPELDTNPEELFRQGNNVGVCIYKL